jgi:hypothetical protein
VTAPNGRILVHDRENTRIDVVYRPRDRPTVWTARPEPGATTIADPYFQTDSPIQLTGALHITTHACAESWNGRLRSPVSLAVRMRSSTRA